MNKKAQIIYIYNITHAFVKRVGRAHEELHSRFFFLCMLLQDILFTVINKNASAYLL